MSTRSQLTKDLNDSVKHHLGKQVKILFKNVVRLEIKGDKTENRVLIDCHFHYLEIQAVESKRGNQLSLIVNDKVYSFLTSDDSTCSLEVDTMIAALATAIRNIFPTVPLHYIIKKMEVIPSSRIQQITDVEVLVNSREIGPCGGFSTQYACMCDYHNMPYHEEVAWDVDNIYVALKSRELNLKDFDHLEQRDLVPIISALEYNTWFTKMKVTNVRLSHETIERILHVLRRSLSLEELYFDNLGLKSDFVTKLSSAIKNNKSSLLHTLDLPYNPIEDKGATTLASCLSTLNERLIHLNLSHCGLSSKGVNNIFQALTSSCAIYSTLSYLNLSDNYLKDDLSCLYTFLSQPNAIRYLDLSSCEIVLETLFTSLVRGCIINLVHLNVSKNPFSSKKSKEPPFAFKQFFTSAINLKYINLSLCKLAQEPLKNLLLGLACNEYSKEITLDISNNSLGAQGAHVLESCVHGIRPISTLDISDNGLDIDLSGVLLAINKNKSLRHINIGRNMNNMKAKHTCVVLESLIQVIQDDSCVIQSLLMADSKLKLDLHNFLNALGNNKCLEVIDISGNFIGDSGARLLAKALQVNTKLKTIIYDKNCITLQGFHDIAGALATNYSVQYMPYPIYDITACMKTSAERTELVMRRIQDFLNRNAVPNIGNIQEIHSITQSGYALSSKQDCIARLTAQTQEVVKKMASEPIASNKDVNFVTNIIQDADNSKALFGQLREIVKQRDIYNSIEQKLEQFACDIQNSLTNHLENTAEQMVKISKSLCPSTLNNKCILTTIKRRSSSKFNVSENFAQQLVQEQLRTPVINKVRELSFAIAKDVTFQVLDEVQDALLKSYKIVIGESEESALQRPRINSQISSEHGTCDISIRDNNHQFDHSRFATPNLSNKRKSVRGRRLRPKSVVNIIEGLSANDITCLEPTPRNSEEDDSIVELPNVTNQLQHLVKGRPKRTKTRAPSRPLLKSDDVVDAPDVGLDTFFRPGSVTPTSDGSTSIRPKRNSSEFTSPEYNNDIHRKGLFSIYSKSRSSDHIENYSFQSLHKSNSDISSSSRITEDTLTSRENSNISINTGTQTALEQSSTSLSSTISIEPSVDSFQTDCVNSVSIMDLKSPIVRPKPTPTSVIQTDLVVSDMILSSNGSSPVNSTGNTPDSGDTLDSSESLTECKLPTPKTNTTLTM